jgi:SPX domain protein involved in polyphosphate accumulation
MSAFRYELKFLIDSSRRDALLELVSEHLKPDPHGTDSGLYRVTSQYYDSPSLAAYREKMDGEKTRRKYRLRFYGDRPDSPFFEIKHRYDRTIRKERVALDPERTTEFLSQCRGLDGLASLAECRNAVDSGLVGRLTSAGEAQRIEPVVIITYLRQAFVGLHDPGLRLTFDHHGQAWPAGEYHRVSEDLGHPLAPRHPVVMEIKFDDRVPRWMVDGVNMVGLHQIRFSKYTQGVDALAEAGLLVHPEVGLAR